MVTAKRFFRKIVDVFDYAIYRITKYFYDHDDYIGRGKNKKALTASPQAGGSTVVGLLCLNLWSILLPIYFNNPDSLHLLFTPIYRSITILHIIVIGAWIAGMFYASKSKYEKLKQKYESDPKAKRKERMLLVYIILSILCLFTVMIYHIISQ